LLARLYGKGSAKDNNEVMSMCLAEANEGNANGMLDLGHAYFFGNLGVDQDYSRAVEWYRKAAAQVWYFTHYAVHGPFFRVKMVGWALA
jgi:TPR repeat protein